MRIKFYACLQLSLECKTSSLNSEPVFNSWWKCTPQATVQRLEPTSETKDLLANHIQYSNETNHNVPTSDNIAVCMYISFFFNK